MPNILIVDDDDDIRRWLTTVLNANGYEVQEADSPDGVVRQLLSGDIDLVLVDYHMPSQDGLSLLREMHTMHINTPCIMLTVDSSQAVAVECFRNGAADFISKPIDADYLAIIVQRTLAAHAGTLKNMAFRALGYVQHKTGCAHFDNPEDCTCGLQDVVMSIQNFKMNT